MFNGLAGPVHTKQQKACELALGIKCDILGLSPGAHIEEGEDQLPQIVSDLCMYHVADPSVLCTGLVFCQLDTSYCYMGGELLPSD